MSAEIAVGRRPRVPPPVRARSPLDASSVQDQALDSASQRPQSPSGDASSIRPQSLSETSTVQSQSSPAASLMQPRNSVHVIGSTRSRELLAASTLRTVESFSDASSKRSQDPAGVIISTQPRDTSAVLPATAELSSTTATPANEEGENNHVPWVTKYVTLLVESERIPTFHGLLAWFFVWLLLAGFLVLPDTISEIEETRSDGTSFLERLVGAFATWHLFVLGCICTTLGILGMLGLWYKWRKNPVWIVSRIFLPGFIGSLTGLISITVHLYAVHWKLDTTSLVTLSVTGGVGVLCLLLMLFYSFWSVRREERKHHKLLKDHEGQRHTKEV